MSTHTQPAMIPTYYAARTALEDAERANEIGTHTVELSDLTRARDEIDRMIAQRVKGMRAQGDSWHVIAVGLGMTRQGAQQRYGTKA